MTVQTDREDSANIALCQQGLIVEEIAFGNDIDFRQSGPQPFSEITLCNVADRGDQGKPRKILWRDLFLDRKR